MFCLNRFFFLFLLSGFTIGVRSLPAAPLSETASAVTVYMDGLYRNFGYSSGRQLLLSVKKGSFQSSETKPVSREDGILTMVTLSSERVKDIRNMDTPLPRISLNGRTIYYYNKDGIEFSFSLERPGEDVLNLIIKVYAEDPPTLREVMKYYRDNYIIRIFSAENIIHPEKKDITFEEAMLMATLLGDSFQPLLGIHDGKDILKKY